MRGELRGGGGGEGRGTGAAGGGGGGGGTGGGFYSMRAPPTPYLSKTAMPGI